MTFGERISLLRKQLKYSQRDLAKAIGTSAPIIGRYEREEIKPSIDVAKKIADAFGVSLDFLVGEGQNSKFDKKTLSIIQEIENVEPSTREKLYFLVNAVIRDYKTQQAYGSAS